jgi:RIO-like serine/threonine protein kinase
VVVKFGREQGFCGVPLAWLGRFLRDREEALYATLEGVAGVPHWVGRVGRRGCAIEFIEGAPLDHVASPPAGFFDRLAEVFRAVHARGVGYGDANKRSNILIAASGEPYLVDYQIAIRRRDDWPWPFRGILAGVVEYIRQRDLYHLYKHKRRICPQELTPEQDALSRRRGGLHRLHRKLSKPWRAFRRRFLRGQYRSGRLQSPSADWEDHYQPEKESWRGRKE